MGERDDVPQLMMGDPDCRLIFDDPDSMFPNQMKLARQGQSR